MLENLAYSFWVCLFMIGCQVGHFLCWNFGTLSKVMDQFIVLGENKSDLADILSVLFMA